MLHFALERDTPLHSREGHIKRIIVRRRLSGGRYDFVKARQPKAEGHELIFTDTESEAKIWASFYAVTDYICKSGTVPVGFEIIRQNEVDGIDAVATAKLKAGAKAVKGKEEGAPDDPGGSRSPACASFDGLPAVLAR
jgi:hypothetical protein